MQPGQFIVSKVAEVLGIDAVDVLSRGKAPQTVKARSLLCYWANRELGMTTVELSKRLRICQSAASRTSQRGERIAYENNFRL